MTGQLRATGGYSRCQSWPQDSAANTPTAHNRMVSELQSCVARAGVCVGDAYEPTDTPSRLSPGGAHIDGYLCATGCRRLVRAIWGRLWGERTSATNPV